MTQQAFHMPVTADRVPASHTQPRRPELRPLQLPLPRRVCSHHGGRPGPAPWEPRMHAWSGELEQGARDLVWKWWQRGGCEG